MAGPSLKTREEGRKQKFRFNGFVAGISLVLAIFLWLLVTLRAQEFRSTVSYPLVLTHVPPGIEISSPLPERIQFLVEGKGSNLLFEHLKFKNDTLFLDFLRWGMSGHVSFTEFGKNMNHAEMRGIRFLTAFPDSLLLRFELRYTQKSNVVPNLDLSQSGLFRVPQVPKIIPDSVTLQGPEDLLQQLKDCRTKPIIVPNKRGKAELESELLLPDGVSSFPPSVKVSFLTEAFTEKKIKVKIKSVNLPAHTRLRLSPDQITLTLLLPENKFTKVREQDISAIVDFSTLRETARFVIPEIRFSIPEIEVIRMEPESLNFLIIRE